MSNEDNINEFVKNEAERMLGELCEIFKSVGPGKAFDTVAVAYIFTEIARVKAAIKILSK